MPKIGAPGSDDVSKFVAHALTCVDELHALVADEPGETAARAREILDDVDQRLRGVNS